jgi:hypothetical protein
MVLDDVFLDKMLNKCLVRYFGDAETIPLTKNEIAHLRVKIREAINGKSEEALYMIIEDIVYDHLTV